MKETTAIRAVAHVAPWLAPLPAAYFIGRASYLHLFTVEPWPLRLPVSLVIGLVVEVVSLAAFHTRLDLDRWNRTAEARHWEKAPTGAVNAAIGAYLAGVIVLLVVLESLPAAARWAPVLFPLLGVAGVLVLAAIGQHDDRKAKYSVDDSLRAARKSAATEAQLLQPAAVQDAIPTQLDAMPTKTGRVRVLAGLHGNWNLAQLATEAGCSVSTASRALANGNDNGHKRIAVMGEAQDAR